MKTKPYSPAFYTYCFFIFLQKKKSQKTETATSFFDKEMKTCYEILFENWNVNKLESLIKKDYKIDIEWEGKDAWKEAFGIWKEDKRSLKEIRKKAWQRAK